MEQKSGGERQRPGMSIAPEVTSEVCYAYLLNVPLTNQYDSHPEH